MTIQFDTIKRAALFITASMIMASACAAQTSPRTGRETTELVFAPDGQTLWSEVGASQLVIRSSDGQSEQYRGSLSGRSGGGLRVLKDGSFLRATQSGALQWFEPPQAGQPLRLRRELPAPPAMEWELDGIEPTAVERAREGARTYGCQFGGGKREPGALRSAGALAVAPDEKRVAVSFTIRRRGDGFDSFDSASPKQQIIRVWNLQSGVVEMKQSVLLPGWSNDKAAPDALPFYPACLGWADAQTLVVARGLSIRRFDATTGQQTDAWKPSNAPQAFGVARAMNEPNYATLSPAVRTIYNKMVPSIAFDVEAQQLIALSEDGTQLVLFDYAKSLLTLWNSATDTAQILSEKARISPLGARFSSDGTKVAIWDNWSVRSWRSENRSQPFYPAILQTTTGEIKVGGARSAALTGDFIALASDNDTPFVLRFVPDVDFGRRPAR